MSPRNALGWLTLFALVLVVGAFVFEYGFDARPCRVCWWQRYTHWALLAVAAFGYLWPRHSRKALLLAFVPALTGLGIAVYHTLVEFKLLPAPTGCTEGGSIDAGVNNFLQALQNLQPEVACDVVGFRLLGLSLSNWNIAAMLVAVLFIAYTVRRCAKMR